MNNFLFLFHLHREYVLLIDLNIQEYFQNVMLKNEY